MSHEVSEATERAIPWSREELLAMFDYRDGVLVWKPRGRHTFNTEQGWKIWSAQFPGKVAGRLNHGYVRTRINTSVYANHRLIYFMFTGEQPRMIDHIDGNPSNNRIENLRPATASANQANKGGKPGKLKGAFRCENGKWYSTIRKDGKSHYLGIFESQIDAHQAYMSAARRLHGEFARA